MGAKRPNVGRLHDPDLNLRAYINPGVAQRRQGFFSGEVPPPTAEVSIRPKRLFKDLPTPFREKPDFLAARLLSPVAGCRLRTSIVVPTALVPPRSHGR